MNSPGLRPRTSTDDRIERYRSSACVVMVILALGFFSKASAPVEASSQARREAGASLFHESGCEYCHGASGVGTKRAPSLTFIGRKWKKSQLERQILNGGHEMPPFRDALEGDQVKSLVDYLKAKK